MKNHYQIQDAINTLKTAFAPLDYDCHIIATRKGNFSFTVVNKAGIARHTRRLYSDQYSQADLQNVIEQAKLSIG